MLSPYCANLAFTDRDLRTSVTAWLGIWNDMQERCREDENYVMSNAAVKEANRHMHVILTTRAATFEGIAAKSAVLTALDGNSDRLALGLCSDIQRFGRG